MTHYPENAFFALRAKLTRIRYRIAIDAERVDADAASGPLPDRNRPKPWSDFEFVQEFIYVNLNRSPLHANVASHGEDNRHWRGLEDLENRHKTLSILNDALQPLRHHIGEELGDTCRFGINVGTT